jgi:asparagine synthase (glutamine-hydrolysing)
MCGIAAIVNADPERAARMRAMLAALQHRGPDGTDLYSDEHATLGHRRLAIIDIEGGRQPLRNADDSIWLVCNGEIYDYRAQRAQLERTHRYRFRTNSDCEVIIALYEVYGDDCVAHLRGMFAFALWDRRRRRLLVARDHRGQKPLYYTWDRNGFVCASEIKALLATDPARRQLNLAALDQYLGLRLVEAPLSMFEGIHKLPPAHLLILEQGRQPELRRYWQPAALPKFEGGEESLTDELESRIEDSLRLHMVSDVPVGAFLSGGLDSGLLVAMLAKRLGAQRLPTFTVGLEYRQFDEAPAARQVASLYGTDHREQQVVPQLTRLLPDVLWALDEPADPLSLCMWLLAEFAARHVKVVLGGDGGDELFGGYDRYYGNLYAEQYSVVPAAVRRAILAPAVALLPARGWYKSVGHQLRWLHELSRHDGSARYAASLTYFYFDAEHRRQLFAPELRETVARLDAEATIRNVYEQTEGDCLDRMLEADARVRLPNHPAMITDRMTMAHGLEVRSPFMDHKLVEFAMRLPSSLKVRGMTLRHIQRRLAARYLPQEIIERPKQGFASAMPYMLRTAYDDLSRAFLRDSHLVAAGILDGGAIGALIDAHAARQADHGQRLWLLLNAELWYRMMIEGVSREGLREQMPDLSSPSPRERRVAT